MPSARLTANASRLGRETPSGMPTARLTANASCLCRETLLLHWSHLLQRWLTKD
jgi:hypothetical protein